MKHAKLNDALRSIDQFNYQGLQYRDGCHHRHGPAMYVELVMKRVDLTISPQGTISMKVTFTWTTPATRLDGTPLALTDIKTTNVSRNGAVIASPVAVAGVNTFVDTTPLTGSDAYTVDTVTSDGLVSADSNSVSVTVANANPAAAITDLAAVLSP